jgi:hypothetical protein
MDTSHIFDAARAASDLQLLATMGGRGKPAKPGDHQEARWPPISPSDHEEAQTSMASPIDPLGARTTTAKRRRPTRAAGGVVVVTNALRPLEAARAISPARLKLPQGAVCGVAAMAHHTHQSWMTRRPAEANSFVEGESRVHWRQ